MTRPRAVVEPAQDDPSFTLTELTDEESEKAAAGDASLLSDSSFANYRWSIWRQRTKEEIARDPAAPVFEFVVKKVGPLEIESLQAEVGGGVFDIRGYVNLDDGRGEKMRRRATVAFAGPRKVYGVETQAAVVVQTPNVAMPPALERFLDKLLDRVERIEQRPVTPAAPMPTMKDMAETLLMLDGLRGGKPTDPNIEVVSTYMDLINRGIEIGRERGPGDPSEGTDWTSVIEKTAPIANKLMDAILMSRRRQPTRSSATIVDDTTTPPAAPAGEATPPPSAPAAPTDGPAMSHRWQTAIESLVRAISEQDDPGDFAVTLRSILSPDEFGVLLFAEPKQVISEINQASAGRYGILGTPHALVFVDAVLREIKNPSDSQDNSSTAG